jgi:hypothetical protein
MNKLTTNNRRIYNQEVLEELIAKYGFSRRYIRMAITGDRVGKLPEEIKKDFNAMSKAASDAIHGRN